MSSEIFTDVAINNRRARYEPFGGIIWLEDIPATVFVDVKYMKALGFKASELWKSSQTHLTAPLNVHFNLTQRCPKKCDWCYTDSQKDSDDDLPLPQIKTIIDELAKMRVFSIAFGGGEPFTRSDLFEIARYSQSKGVTPTATTNGFFISEKNVKECAIFEHIHVSVDLSDEGEFPIECRQWHKAITLLKQERIPVGINYVVNKNGYEHLEEICFYGRKFGVENIMFLRFKPFGRAVSLYEKNKLSREQNIDFFSLLKKLTRKYRIKSAVDCSFLPMICGHRPDKRSLEFFGAQGCQGGNYIAEIDYRGFIRCCSFCKDFAGEGVEILRLWDNSSHFKLFRDWIKNASHPCNSCDYLELCRGGCHAIAETLTGNVLNPDPECPRVLMFG